MILTLRTYVERTAIASLVVAAAACGSGEPATTDAPDADADAGSVVATTSIWADVVSNTLCGADVAAIIPSGADAHGFEPSLRDRERVEAADVVFANGLGLEGGLEPMLDTARDRGAVVVELATLVDVIDADEQHEADTDHDDDHHDDHDDETHDQTHDDHGDEETHDDHGDENHDETHDAHEADHEADHDDAHHVHEHADGDPHVWQDPRRVARVLDDIADAARPLGIPTCVDEYRTQLDRLDDDIEQILDRVEPAHRQLVTSHDSLGYFAERYDFDVVGSVIPATNTLAETNSADLAELADTIEAEDVRAIFTEALASTADADALAERLDVRIIPLVTDALTDDPASDTYVEMMRSNAERIAEALAP